MTRAHAATGRAHAVVRAGALTAALFAILAPARAAPKDWPEITAAERALTSVPGDPGAPAVVLRAARDGRIVKRGSDTSNILDYHWRLKVLNDRGKEYAEVQIPAGKFSRVTGVEGRTVRPDGSIVSVPADQIFLKTVVRARGHRETAYVFHFPAVEPGAIVEYRYQRVVNNLAFVTPWPFSGPLDVMMSRVSQAAPDEASYTALCHNCPDPKPVITPWREGPEHGRRFEWTVRDLPALRAGEWMPPERVAGTHLEMVLKSWHGAYWPGIDRADTFISDWDTAARFVGYFYQAVLKDGQGTLRSLAKEWTAGLSDREAAIRAIVTHVQRDFRYVGSDDIYAITRPIDDIVKDRSADNEEKAVLLAGVLRAFGVNASIALVAGRDHGPLYQNFYSLSEFSHVIVLIPEGDDSGRWIDPTVTWAPFGFLPWRDAGAGALVIKPNGGLIVGLPQFTGVGLTRFDVTLRPLPGGAADVEARVLFDGEDAVEMREDLIPASDAERREVIRAWLEDARPDAALASFSLLDLDDVDKPLRLEVSFRAQGLVTRAEGILTVRPCVFECYATNPLPHGTRTQPFFVDRGRRRMQTVTVVPPEGFAPVVLPEPASASSAIGALSFGCDRAEGGAVSCVRAFTLPRDRIKAAEADGVRAMFDAIVGLDRDGVVFQAAP